MTNELLAKIDLLTEQLEDYKQRNEKAVEYIKKCQLGVDSMDRPYMLLDQEEGKDLLNILQGGNE